MDESFSTGEPPGLKTDPKTPDGGVRFVFDQGE
jgi:hypothetical protein